MTKRIANKAVIVAGLMFAAFSKKSGANSDCIRVSYVFLSITAMSPISPPRITNNPPSPPPMIPTIMSTIAQTIVVTLLEPMIAIMPQITATIPK